MGRLDNLVTQLNRTTEHKVLNIKEVHTSAMYIGQKQYNIFFEHEGTTHNYMIPCKICSAISHWELGWELVRLLDEWLKEVKEAKAKKHERMRSTSCKRNTRKQINKIKVRGYYENM